MKKESARSKASYWKLYHGRQKRQEGMSTKEGTSWKFQGSTKRRDHIQVTGDQEHLENAERVKVVFNETVTENFLKLVEDTHMPKR